MAILEKNGPAMQGLESLIDQVGLRNVVYALALISAEKAEHLRSNWQDDASARVWDSDARKLDSCAAKLSRTIIIR
jgi:hypothetical protein